MSPARVSQVAVIILFDGEKMLINLRPKQTYFGGWWEWPGGKVEAGESPEQCARRELREEIGLEAGPLTELEKRVVQHPDREVQLTSFMGRVLPGQQAREGALLHRWVLPAEALEYKFLEGSLPTLKRIIEEKLSPPA